MIDLSHLHPWQPPKRPPLWPTLPTDSSVWKFLFIILSILLFQNGLFIKVSYSSLYLASLLAFFFTCFTLCYFFLCFFCAVLRSRSCFDRLRLQGKKSLNVTVVQQQCLRSMFVSEYRFGSGSDSSLWFVLIWNFKNVLLPRLNCLKILDWKEMSQLNNAFF